MVHATGIHYVLLVLDSTTDSLAHKKRMYFIYCVYVLVCVCVCVWGMATGAVGAHNLFIQWDSSSSSTC